MHCLSGAALDPELGSILNRVASIFLQCRSRRDGDFDVNYCQEFSGNLRRAIFPGAISACVLRTILQDPCALFSFLSLYFCFFSQACSCGSDI